MTTYFDDLSMRLHEARAACDYVALEQIECEVVRDVSQLAYFGGAIFTNELAVFERATEVSK